ncbi:MAG: Ig-like domain-containing protein [Clostridia bacterium]|nr:Ig-like domain-containing protein [Clostridia bacterium]
MKSFIKVLAVFMILAISLCGLPVAAMAADEPVDKDLVKLPDGLLKNDFYSPHSYDFTDILPSTNDSCFYAIGEDDLYKYDLTTNECQMIESYNLDMYFNITSRYVTNDKIYLIDFYNLWGDADPWHSEILCYDLNSQTLESVAVYYGERLTAIGADKSGRIYVSGEVISTDDEASPFLRILDSSGNKLSEITIDDEVYDFVGFDEERGYFFTNGYYNYRSWGYDHYMNALRVGSVDKDNNIYYDNNVVMTVSQIGYNDRPKQAQLIHDDYLAIDASFYEKFYVIPMETFVPGSGRMDVTASIPRTYDSGDYDSYGAVGTRSVYMEENDALIFCIDDKTIMECNPDTGKTVGKFTTQYDVYAMYEYDGQLLLFEKNGDDFYYCILELERPEMISATPEEVVLEVGEEFKLHAEIDGIYTPDIVWKSENPYIATVNEDGTVFGWHKGSTTITVSSEALPEAKVKVTVTECSSYDEPALSISESVKKRIFNESTNNYDVWSKTVKSYITENADGTFTLVSADSDCVYVDTYSADFSSCVEALVLDSPMNLFGGYYSGEKYNFLVFGQENKAQSDDQEIIRVQKYSKIWELLDSLSLYGENTSIPFDAGSLRLIEAEGLLYVHTCHEMYADEEGVNHQANMTFVVDTETTELTDIFSDVLNISQAGYVSHSFNQFVASDDEYIYRIDHGDASPRGISIIKTPIGGDITKVDYAVPVRFEGGYGSNATGASIGGVECSTNSVIIAGNMCSDNENIWSSARNIFVNITSKDLYSSETVTITDYGSDSDITALTPHLVKLGNDQFFLIWEECNESDYTYKTKMVTIDSKGNMTSDIAEMPYRLSDCAPVYAADNTVKWFVNSYETAALYSVNPFKLNEIELYIEDTTAPEEESTPSAQDPTNATEDTPQDSTEGGDDNTLLGDANMDGKLNIRDATAIQKHLAKVRILEDSVLRICDFNSDGKVNVKDATSIQKYLAGILSY